ncbi:MAG: DnaJ domain-containing protein [Candidatus Caldarchaeum sp.]
MKDTGVKDYYKILGVSPNASQQEIESAYRKIVRENHPDLYPGDKEREERLKQANEAYAILKDPKKREEYDQIRRGGAQGVTSKPSGTHRPHRGTPSSGLLEDLFERLSQQAGHSPVEATSAQTVSTSLATEYELRLTAEEAKQGTSKILLVNGHRVKIRIPPGVKDGTKIPLIVRIRIHK